MNKNKKLLDEFTEYCNQNTELRFWECLRFWVGFNYIFVSNNYDVDKNEVIGAIDTFYWQEKDK